MKITLPRNVLFFRHSAVVIPVLSAVAINIRDSHRT